MKRNFIHPLTLRLTSRQENEKKIVQIYMFFIFFALKLGRNYELFNLSYKNLLLNDSVFETSASIGARNTKTKNRLNV